LYDPIDWDKSKKLVEKLRYFGFPAMMKYTVTKENISHLEEVLDNLPKAGVDWFQTKPYNRIEALDIDKKYELDPGQIASMARTLLRFRKEYPGIKTDLLPLCYEFLVDDSLPVESLSPCNCGKGPSGYLVVSPAGDVRICGAYPEPIGNIKNDTITDLWKNHPLLKQVRNLANRPKPKECSDCSHWEKCARTDCHSATYAKYGNYNHGNPQCPLISMHDSMQ
jgi:radical SAM protein with 4Fe4S-binding SPASM domain